MNNIKAILFDVDGVLIRPPHYFSKELELKGYKKAEEGLNAYYRGKDHLQCLDGRADSRKLIMPYLKNFGWEYSADEYLEQQFAFERRYLDKGLISIVASLRAQGLNCYLATDQEKYRAQYLLESMDFKSVFDASFISCFVHGRKSQDRFWEKVINELKKMPAGIEPDEIAFFDDIQENIDTASTFGVKAFLFEIMSKFREDMALLGFNVIVD